MPIATLCRIVVIAKAPVPGLCKTRLIPALGAQGAARLAARMLQHAVQSALAANIGPVEICAAPCAGHVAWQALDLPSNVHWSDQAEGDLGRRMAAAAQRTLARGEHVMLIGSDCPALCADTLKTSSRALDRHDAALVPTFDGGYALLALARFHAGIFEKMPWSTPEVAGTTLARFAQDRWRVQVGEMLHDIDEPADLMHLPKALRVEMESLPHAT